VLQRWLVAIARRPEHMSPSNPARIRLPSINEVTEEMILELRDHPELEACSHCTGDQGEHIGDLQVELYSPHYRNNISVYGCPHCFRIWYHGSSMELA
jgi:hypothetical protein